ncbi:hypothetical protein ETB97_010950 [Aspergillus alliaceus]|uniref:Alcohol dehydrogenase-like N-terminal domain-containing protein n=1 Tax=Petromyces alliaceus TaxID=209559 RepID=A0A8H6AA14_PETAA|nr:hypothetical protein ETB97_010950 [Aspergillus burnettii]
MRTARQELDKDIVTVELDRFDAKSAPALAQVVNKMYDRDIQRVDVFPGYEYAISEGLLHVSSHYWATVNFVTPRFNEGVPKKLSLGALGPDEIELDVKYVKYVGLNFIDITISLGVVGDGSQLGLKCTGIVRRVGSAVEHVKPGDKALAFSCGSFRTRIIISERICFKIDEKYSLESAITIPYAYTTAI